MLVQRANVLDPGNQSCHGTCFATDNVYVLPWLNRALLELAYDDRPAPWNDKRLLDSEDEPNRPVPLSGTMPSRSLRHDPSPREGSTFSLRKLTRLPSGSTG
jgi:hypothetical protein